jgi:secreted PhoX family phosphatase
MDTGFRTRSCSIENAAGGGNTVAERIRKEKAMKHGDKATLGRREFLRTIGAGAGLAATAAVPLATNAAATQADAEKNKTRYQETDHVKTFYRVNGYPKS